MIQDDYKAIAAQFAKAYANRDGSLLLVENPQGFAIVINRQHGAYQAHVNIEPNRQTGSSVGLTGDYWDTVSMEDLLKIVKEYNGGLSRHIYSASDMASVKFLTIEQSVNKFDNILGYSPIV